MRISTVQLYQRGLEGIQRRQLQISETQMQVSSGKRFVTPSDDPAASARVLEFNRAIASTEQYQKNIIRIKNRLEIEENTLSGVSNILQRVRELGLQGVSESLTGTQRAYLAAELRELEQSLVDLANTTDTFGDYLFSGYQGAVRPFSQSGGSR
ncbi:MAG: flagellar hook-associated protein 3 [Candidatus Sedimenticola endophacoides]|uniref:Flagellar hook-associated protein 3 n=1 Tax=Candidatus Sedimenticola endophacoides TaxID=2548426 RepID=A0A6N4DU38_9GAMM|nr:MAG: flagellar hook-associated protein 3 [Candidatus Sedimenticola endophacoides]OQX33318.1 MAG: flagellar hook-associated protein 3 [Candidatus Sedimenticola endophacoides]OQX42401.1 MAG: flagellar hook-associated protein 3 [Candidatus Sedimenticola endophacoides]OQX44083.1 MAG: flagellar hook-associated protein 3 [Candidatus Sedimenticola endophacoides]PUD99940.1 MAG: flagellar hook-associated protein 3 [Candidatus Sedimenticola endophacoides]